ncbi:amidohydrolase [Streptomyces sp. NPDC059003]|uniref:amidohydrolase n=1 Tax=Streptomyces sp. NPDC059003 TaxID=3346691 RepID=UPI00368FCC45
MNHVSRKPGTGVPGAGGAPERALLGTLPETIRADLIAFRRDLHMHPELGYREFRTTEALKSRLECAGLIPRVLDCGTGLICDIGEWDNARSILALRADLDALPIADTKTGVPYSSTVLDRAHACGHDVHTTVVLGAGLVLAKLYERGQLAHPVRMIFQPAEEVLPGGANEAITSGALDGVGRIVAVHCDPRVDVGRIGLRHGAITSACDRLEVTLGGVGGHTARPHLTTDLVTAAAKLASEVPALIARRIDPRSGLSLTWGRIASGHTSNVIPQRAELSGTVRCLDLASWREAPALVRGAVTQVADLYRAESNINYVRGVPPVVNDPDVTDLLRGAMTARRGPQSIEQTEQSLGGEDFSWYLEKVPGAMARLGVRTPGHLAIRDLHRGDFDVDESAITVGVELLTATALLDSQNRA